MRTLLLFLLIVPALAAAAARHEAVASGLARPWSLAFLPDGSYLVTEKHGGVKRILRTGAVREVRGAPDALKLADSGLLDLALDPDFASNALVYLAFVEGTERANRTALYRARLAGDALLDGRVVFRARPDKADASHPGARLLFLPDRTLLMTVGDGYHLRDHAQRLDSHLGKVVRLTRDGRAPADNPFVGRAGALPEIWTLGHRNPQGLLRDPRDGTVWLHEHGPRGGDEINRLRAGANYGWPRATHGIDYDGTRIAEAAELPGMERPVVVWTPSIAPSGFALYLGSRHAEWRGDFFVGALAARELRRVRLRDGVAAQETLLGDLAARIRDVRVGPDGHLYVLTDEDAGRLLRILPGA